MRNLIRNFRRHLAAKLILSVGVVLLVSISTWAYFNIENQKRKAMVNIVESTDRLSSTILLGTHYAMMLNSRDDINQIITNIGRQPEIQTIRIYNKAGEIKFSNLVEEIDREPHPQSEACVVCHQSEPPLSVLDLEQRTRIFHADAGHRLLRIISAINNEPGCATDTCHVHPEGKKILGALDVVVSLTKTDTDIVRAERDIIVLAIFVFLVTSFIIFLFVLTFVNRPIKRLIEGTRRITDGDYTSQVVLSQPDEMGQLGHAINQMGASIGEQQSELNQQRDEYQNLFEQVPCIITVQDRNYRLIQYNKEFSDKFGPKPGDYCYHAYKGREEKCDECPVEKTFMDGRSHYSEESGVNKDGTRRYWMVRTSPIRNADGEIVAAMEMNLDISERKQLEVDLEKSEKNYHAVFSNIPNPVFVLDMETLNILDSNNSVTPVYGYKTEEIKGTSFLDLFVADERDYYAVKLMTTTFLNQVRHLTKEGRTLYVTIRISLSEYSGRKVFLVTTSDITKRLEAEQQLIQASKMATLGEMATGIAHELNQPLSVIKTVSSFFLKKIQRNEEIKKDTLDTMLGKVDTNVDRATKIIHHMRQFARKSEMEMARIQVNDVLESAFEIFSQQLKVRGIETRWQLQEDLPRIDADPGRLEQVFINLLVNARDAVEEKWSDRVPEPGEKYIALKTRCDGHRVICDVCDSGVGIPSKLLDKVFEPFFTTKEVGKGTGLGLSISYGIVKECGGRIYASSENGNGTCFHLEFPLPGHNGHPLNRDEGIPPSREGSTGQRSGA